MPHEPHISHQNSELYAVYPFRTAHIWGQTYLELVRDALYSGMETVEEGKAHWSEIKKFDSTNPAAAVARERKIRPNHMGRYRWSETDNQHRYQNQTAPFRY